MHLARAAESFFRRRWLAGTMQQRLLCRATNRSAGLLLTAIGAARFRCSICQYRGPFFSYMSANARRENAMCPGCGSLERHRLQWLVLDNIPEKSRFHSLSLLHIAPEAFFGRRFRRSFRRYITSDLPGHEVDCAADITELPFANNSFDVVFASHVLEHVKEDRKALAEIRRVLSPLGIAFLPVPIFTGIKTVEYPEPNPSETYHVRQPGYDYYDRYTDFFSKVVKYSSADFSPDFQLYIHEDRSGWPTPTMPYRRPMSGTKHEDVVPVCYK
jgi:SAM-dependent methyltransferase